MKRPSDDSDNWESLRTRIIGLGERSLRKNYYPELQQRLTELERFRALLDQSNDAIFLVQIPSGRLSDFNVTACQQSGYTRDELLNLSARDLVPENTISDVSALAAHEPPDTRSRETFITFLRQRDGAHLPVEVTARQVRFEGELFAVIVARDITERHQAEERLRLLNFAMDNVHEAAFLIDENAHFCYINEGACRVLGYTRDELLGLSVPDVDPDFPLERWSSHWNDLKTQRSLTFEGRHKTKDGRIFPVEINANYFEYDGQGYDLGLVRDITKRQRAEEELARHREHLEELVTERTQQLRESEQHYRRLFETMLQGVVYRDAAGRVISFNPAAERILGGPPFDLSDPAIERAADEIREDGTPLPVLEHPAMIALRTGREIRDVVIGVYNPREQGYRWIRVSAVPVFRSAADQPAEVYTLFNDITERKRAADEIRQLNQTLQERAIDLETANTELEAFAYSVSHDLRAPLRHIDGFLDLLQQKTAAGLDEQSQRYLVTIAQAVKRMEALIDDLLSFSRLGRHDLSRIPVDLNELVQDARRELEPDIRGRAIQWHIGNLPVVTGDRALLRLVMVNLLSNALKFTRSTASAEIEIGSLPPQAQAITVFVRDNGAGFDMAYAHKLFGVFQRLHHVEEFEGTGIGLANVRRIIQRHGGQTWATGEVGRGATFYFSLPQTD